MSYFSAASARPFGDFAKCIINSKGRLSGAVDHADIAQVSTDVRRELRSLGLLSELMASTFYQDASREFVATLRPFSAFAQIAALANVIPRQRRIAAMTAVIEAAPGAEGALKAVSNFDMTDGQATPLKAIAMIIQSQELASALGEAGTDFLLDQLRSALGPASDRAFFNSILAGVTPAPATGTAASDFRADISAALLGLGLTAASRPVIVVDPAQAVSLSTLENGDGSTAFPDLDFRGGTGCGVPVFVSGGIPLDDSTSPAARQIVVLDCQAVALDPGSVGLQPAQHATVEIEGQKYSLFADNLLGLLAEHLFAADVVRAGGVATITGANYGAPSETSP